MVSSPITWCIAVISLSGRKKSQDYRSPVIPIYLARGVAETLTNEVTKLGFILNQQELPDAAQSYVCGLIFDKNFNLATRAETEHVRFSEALGGETDAVVCLPPECPREGCLQQGGRLHWEGQGQCQQALHLAGDRGEGGKGKKTNASCVLSAHLCYTANTACFQLYHASSSCSQLISRCCILVMLK